MNSKCLCAALVLAISSSTFVHAQPVQRPPTREQWGAPLVSVTHTNGQWIIAGKKRKLILNEMDLALEVRTGAAVWKMRGAGSNDMLLKFKDREYFVNPV